MGAVWHIYSAVILRRTPLVLPEINLLERRIESIFNNYEIAYSKLSAHELRHLKDQRLANKVESDKSLTAQEIGASSKQTAQDFEDDREGKRKNFKFAPLKTKEDLDENRKSLNRCLDRDLILVSRQIFGTDLKSQWLLPQAENQGNEQLIDTARRALCESIGMDAMLQCRFLGMVPASVYSFNYPKKVASQAGAKGAKVFFMKAYAGSDLKIRQEDVKDDYEWLNREECYQRLHRSYWYRVNQSLLSEERVAPEDVLKKAYRNRLKVASASLV